LQLLDGAQAVVAFGDGGQEGIHRSQQLRRDFLRREAARGGGFGGDFFASFDPRLDAGERLDIVVAKFTQGGGGHAGAVARRTVDEHRLVGRHLVQALRQGADGDVDGAGDVPLAYSLASRTSMR
jgi:hypothetical protein